MKTRSFTRGSLLLVLSVLATANAGAVCTGSGATGSFYGFSYIHSAGTNVPPSLLGVFWAFGFGSPANGAGDDNGGWASDESTAADPDGWLVPYDGFDVSFLDGDWSASQEVNGCIVGHIAPGKSGEIMVAAVFDVTGSSAGGMFGVMAVQRDPVGTPDFEFTFPTTPQFDLVSIPRPFILSSSRAPAGAVTVTLRGPTLAEASAGVLTDGSVSATELVRGYRIYVQSFPSGTPAPVDRRIESGWTLVAGTTPLGENVAVVLENLCEHTVLAQTFVLDSGFETPFVSFNSATVDTRACDPVYDLDGDGYNPNACCPFSDCDDGNAAVHPGAAEVCNGLDNDCDGIVNGSPDGADSDADGVQDLCDVCTSVYDPRQGDFDHDGQGDACDLNDGLILVGFPNKSQVSWQPETGFIAWNLYRADLGVLAAGGEYTQEPGSNPLARRDCDLGSTQLADSLNPSTGRVAFSLVSGETASGEGSLGTDSEGNPRANSHPCP